MFSDGGVHSPYPRRRSKRSLILTVLIPFSMRLKIISRKQRETAMVPMATTAEIITAPMGTTVMEITAGTTAETTTGITMEAIPVIIVEIRAEIQTRH